MAKFSVLYTNLYKIPSPKESAAINPQTIYYVQFLISNLKNCAISFLVSHLQINYQLKIFLHEKCNDEGVHTCIYVTDRETLRIFLVKISSNKFIFDTKYENETMHPYIHLFFGKWNAIKTIH